jgi:hypothetical protein
MLSVISSSSISRLKDLIFKKMIILLVEKRGKLIFDINPTQLPCRGPVHNMLVLFLFIFF